MPKYSPNAVASQIGSGLLSFPVTHLSQENVFVQDAYREHLEWLILHKPAGLFAAGGTGEFFSLSMGEFKLVVGAAVAQTNGRVPVIAGCGYGTSTACEMAAIAEQAGADGILLLPPYLVNSEQEGLAAHVEAVCKSTSLAVIVYNRDNAILSVDTLERLCASCPNLVGYKDGVGDVELMVKISNRMGERLVYVGGLPTAEIFAYPYLEMGVSTYSSAIFNFAPEYAQRFYAAVRARDVHTVSRELRDFILPFTTIRDRRKGYAVSIIKAGLKIVGRPAGPVRGPLLELEDVDMADLRSLMEKAGIARQ